MRIQRSARVAGLVIAVSTSIWFFFNFITLLIGAALVLCVRELRWKFHGAAIAFLSGLAAMVALRLSTTPPLGTLAKIMFTGLGLYTLLVLMENWLRRRFPRIKALVARIQAHPRALHGALIVGGILLPFGFWASVNLHPGVAFDQQPRMLWIHAPTTPAMATPFQVSVQAWDRYERISARYAGTVAFTLESYALDTLTLMAPSHVEAQLPLPYTFSGQKPQTHTDMAYMLNDGKDNGAHTFEINISTPGIHYLVAREIAAASVDGRAHLACADCSFYSNPIVVFPADAAHRNLYWGDLHTHSAYSDGSGSPEHNAFYARHGARLDFYALTDHAEILFFAPWKYRRLEQLANNQNTPGEFVVFQGIEWTNVATGHYTLVFSGERLLHFPALMPGRFGPLSTPDRLWRDLDAFTQTTGDSALALPHHTTKINYPQDWSYLNPKYVRLAEVTSTHGDSLYEQRHPLNYAGGTGAPKSTIHGLSITDALLMGRRLTLYAASDAHSGHPGHSLSHTEAIIGHQRPWTTWPSRVNKPYPGGLTAVYAKTLTREAVFEALTEGRIYANSDHGRPFLQFTVNGVAVGEAASTVSVPSPETPRTLTIRLAQDGAPAAAYRTSAASRVADGWRPNWQATVEILKNGQLLHAFPVTTPVADFTFVDTEPVTGAAYTHSTERDGKFYLNALSDKPIDPGALHTGGADFYIVRVAGENRRYTYAGAIWVTPQTTERAAP